jgi:hypothetical protein
MDRDDRFSSDSLDKSPAQELVIALGYPAKIGGDQLEL